MADQTDICDLLLDVVHFPTAELAPQLPSLSFKVISCCCASHADRHTCYRFPSTPAVWLLCRGRKAIDSGMRRGSPTTDPIPYKFKECDPARMNRKTHASKTFRDEVVKNNKKYKQTRDIKQTSTAIDAILSST